GDVLLDALGVDAPPAASEPARLAAQEGVALQRRDALVVRQARRVGRLRQRQRRLDDEACRLQPAQRLLGPDAVADHRLLDQLDENLVDLLRGQVAVGFAVDGRYRADLAGPHAAGEDLHRDLAIGAGLPLAGDAEAVDDAIDQHVRAEGVAGRAVAGDVDVGG